MQLLLDEAASAEPVGVTTTWIVGDAIDELSAPPYDVGEEDELPDAFPQRT
jgi:hypothetical protein